MTRIFVPRKLTSNWPADFQDVISFCKLNLDGGYNPSIAVWSGSITEGCSRYWHVSRDAQNVLKGESTNLLFVYFMKSEDLT